MSNIGRNIRKIRGVKRLSQAAFAELFDLGRASVGAYEEGRAEPKVDTIIAVSRYFGISTDALLLKTLTVNDIQNFTKDISQVQKPGNFITEDNHIPLVRVNSHLEYILKGKSRKYLTELPSLSVPGISKKDHLAFECKDNSMEWNGKGIMHSDILVCRQIRESDIRLLNEGSAVILVMNHEILARRFRRSGISADPSFIPDNPAYKNIPIQSKQLKEIWLAVSLVSRKVPPLNDLERRVAELEETVTKLINR